MNWHFSCSCTVTDPFHSVYQGTVTLANSEDPDELLHYAAFHLGRHCLLRQKQSSGTEINHFIKILTANPLKYKMDDSILIIPICMR